MTPQEMQALNERRRNGEITPAQYRAAVLGGGAATPEPESPAPPTRDAPGEGLTSPRADLPVKPETPRVWDPDRSAYDVQNRSDAANRRQDVLQSAMSQGTPAAPAASRPAMDAALQTLGVGRTFPVNPAPAEAMAHALAPHVVEERTPSERMLGHTGGGSTVAGVVASHTVGPVWDLLTSAPNAAQMAYDAYTGVPTEDWSQHLLRVLNTGLAAVSEGAATVERAYNDSQVGLAQRKADLAERRAVDAPESHASGLAQLAAQARADADAAANKGTLFAPLSTRTEGVDYVSPEARERAKTEVGTLASDYLLDLAAKVDTGGSFTTDLGRSMQYHLDNNQGELPDWFKAAAPWLATADGLFLDLATPDPLLEAGMAAARTMGAVARGTGAARELAKASPAEVVASGVLRNRQDVGEAAKNGVLAAGDVPGGARGMVDALSPQTREALDREVMAQHGKSVEDLLQEHEAVQPPPPPKAPEPPPAPYRLRAGMDDHPLPPGERLPPGEFIRRWLAENQSRDTAEALRQQERVAAARVEADAAAKEARAAQEAKWAEEDAAEKAVREGRARDYAKAEAQKKAAEQAKAEAQARLVAENQSRDKAEALRQSSPDLVSPVITDADRGHWASLPNEARKWENPPQGKHALYEHPEYQRRFGPSDVTEARYHVSSADGGTTYLSPAMTLDQAVEHLSTRNPADKDVITWEQVRRVGGWRVSNTAERRAKELFAGDRMASSIDEYNVINGWANRQRGLGMNRADAREVRAVYLGKPRPNRRGQVNWWPLVDRAADVGSAAALKAKRLAFGVAPPARTAPAASQAVAKLAEAASRVARGRYGMYFAGDMMRVGYSMVPQALGERLRTEVQAELRTLGLDPAHAISTATLKGIDRILDPSVATSLREAARSLAPELKIPVQPTLADLRAFQFALEAKAVDATGQALRRAGQYTGLMGQVVVPAARSVAKRLPGGGKLFGADPIAMITRANLPLAARQSASVAAAPIRSVVAEMMDDIRHIAQDHQVTLPGAVALVLKDTVRTSPKEARLAAGILSGDDEAIRRWIIDDTVQGRRDPRWAKGEHERSARKQAIAWATSQRDNGRKAVESAVSALLGEDLQAEGTTTAGLKSKLASLFNREPKLFDAALAELAERGMPEAADQGSSLAQLARRAVGNAKAPLAHPADAAVVFIAAERRHRAFEKAADVLVAHKLGTRDPEIGHQLEELFHGRDIDDSAAGHAAYQLWVNNGEPVFDRGGREALDVRTSSGVAEILHQAFHEGHFTAPVGGAKGAVQRSLLSPGQTAKKVLRSYSRGILQGFPPFKSLGLSLTNYLGRGFQEYLTQAKVSPFRLNSWWVSYKLLNARSAAREVVAGTIAGHDAAEFLAACWRNGLDRTAAPLRPEEVLRQLGLGGGVLPVGSKARLAADATAKGVQNLYDIPAVFELASKIDVMQARVTAGASLDEAAVAAREALFEASNVTAFERDVVRYFSSFYLYFRSEFVAGAQAMLEDPRRLAYPARALNRWNVAAGVDQESWGGGNNVADERATLWKAEVPVRPRSGYANPKLENVMLTTGPLGTWSVFHLQDIALWLLNAGATVGGLMPFGIGEASAGVADQLGGDRSVTSPRARAAIVKPSLLAVPYVGRLVANMFDVAPRKLGEGEDPDLANNQNDPSQTTMYVAGGAAGSNADRIRDQIAWSVFNGALSGMIGTLDATDRAQNAWQQAHGEPWVGTPPDPDVPPWMQAAAVFGAKVEKESRPEQLVIDAAARQGRAAKHDAKKPP